MADGLASNTEYLVKLAVQDKSGMVGYANQTLTVGNCAPASVMAISPSATIGCGGTVTLDASASKDVDGSIASYSWKLLYGTQSISKTGVTASVSQLGDKLVTGAKYSVTLTVKDNLGSSSSSSGSLTVQAGCVPVNNPPKCASATPSKSHISTMVSYCDGVPMGLMVTLVYM
jgi:chitinase